MKKIFALLLILTLIPLAGCSKDISDSSKIQITATLFPQYDFARVIGGDKVEVTLLLPPGQESHLYDPSPSDMAKISKSDLFIYTGDMMEGWAGDIAASVGGDVKVLDVSRNIELFHGEHDTSHAHALDPHIWLDFDNAKAMCANIATELILLSPENEDYFTQNLVSYTNSLTDLDNDFKALFTDPQKKELIFGGRFAVGYLTRRYNIAYKSAYDSCSANSEPSVQDIAALSDYVKANDIKVVFCEEFSDPKIAREIASGNNAEVLTVHSCHNTNAEERENNATFVSLMTQNLSNIRKGLE
ncbi:MAG: zinc ABC transporter substrate-binding protein [Clostridia bacterium]|nr:zinc ABC transporter substrate-binding protein [Clostridia bacterium]